MLLMLEEADVGGAGVRYAGDKAFTPGGNSRVMPSRNWLSQWYE